MVGIQLDILATQTVEISSPEQATRPSLCTILSRGRSEFSLSEFRVKILTYKGAAR